MRLLDYIGKAGSSVKDFAASVLVSERTAYRIVVGQKVPNVGTAVLIERFTADAVPVRAWLTDEEAMQWLRM